MRIYVGNLSFNTDEAQLEQLFTTHGPVESVRLIRDHATGRSRGFAFVEMASDDQGRAATWVEALTGLTLDASGSIQSLDRVAWLERREKVERQGGPPVTSPGR